MPPRVIPGRHSPATETDSAILYNPARNGGEPGGVFAEFLQGATPKYAINASGEREVQMRDTMARMFMRLEPGEAALFRNSIGDHHTRDRLAPRLAGTSLGGRERDQLTPEQEQRAPTVVDTGYMDFLLQGVQHQFQEKYQASETLADNYVAYFFGQSPPVWSYNGILLNSVQDDQVSNMVRLYLHLLRGTQLARRQKIVSLKYDSFIVTGALINLTWSLTSQNELLVPFSFQLLVKKVAITNYTRGWTPTHPNGVFASDPHAVPRDGTARADTSARIVVGRAPVDAEETPTPQNQVDPRVHQAPAQSQAAGDAAHNVPHQPRPLTGAQRATEARPEVLPNRHEVRAQGQAHVRDHLPPRPNPDPTLHQQLRSSGGGSR